MENFDSSGGFRSTENDSPIDTNGEIDGMKFNDVIGFTKAVHDHPAGPESGLVNRLDLFVRHLPCRQQRTRRSG